MFITWLHKSTSVLGNTAALEEKLICDYALAFRSRKQLCNSFAIM